jgi:hypothetical protein
MSERHAGKAWTPVNQEKNGIAALPTANKYPLLDTAEFDLLQRVDALCRGNLDSLSGLTLPGHPDRSDQYNEAGKKQSENQEHSTQNVRYLFFLAFLKSVERGAEVL